MSFINVASASLGTRLKQWLLIAKAPMVGNEARERKGRSARESFEGQGVSPKVPCSQEQGS